MNQFIRITRTAALTGACLLSVAALLLASCSQDDLTGGISGGNGISALRVTSTALQAPESLPVSRAAAVDMLTEGSIGIFRSQGTGYTEMQKNRKYTYKNATDGWQPATTADTVFLMANDADVCAYYPYNSTYNDAAAIPLASGKYKGDITNVDDLTATHNPADICYATNNTLDGARVSTAFAMCHAMSMVQLRFERLNYASDNCKMTSVTIKNEGLISTSTLNITDGTYAATPVKASLKWTPGATDADTYLQVPATGMSDATAALLVPCTLDAAGTTFSFTVDGKGMSVKVPASQLPAFEAGKIHRLTFVIHAASVSLSDVSIIDWVSEWNPDYEPNFDGTPQDYIELGGVKWALSNLEYNTTYQNYNFVSSAAAGSTTLPWNALTPSEPGNSTATWDWTLDPCTRLEPRDTWQTPTKEDFAALISLPNAWTDNYKGVGGQWFGTDDADEAALHPDRYLFLPVAYGTSVRYWTQTYGAKNSPHSLLIEKGSAPKEEDTRAYSVYQYVRCVKNPIIKPDYIEIAGIKWAKGNLYQTADGAYHVAEKQGDFYDATISPVTGWEGQTWMFKYGWSGGGSAAILPESEDKCRKVTDGGWCVPTWEQHAALTKEPHVVGYLVNESGNPVRGMYFGTADKTEAETNPDKYLFLPYTGRVTSYSPTNPTIERPGETALYMNTCYEGAGLLRSLLLGKWLNEDFDYIGSLQDDYGSSIRCVKVTD